MNRPRTIETYELSHCGNDFEVPAAEADRTGMVVCPKCGASIPVQWRPEAN